MKQKVMMTNGWQTVQLGEVLKQDTNYVTELEPKIYPKLSVKLYGKGVVLDAPTDGANVKMQRHQFAKPGQIILSEIWAKKGAIGIVPKDGEGALVTSHFFLFDVDETKVLRDWVGLLLKRNYFAETLDSQARGTTGYAAVRPKQFLALEIPLPPLTEQCRIVAHIESLAARVNEAQRLREDAIAETNVLLHSIKAKIFEIKGDTTVKDFADVQSGYAFKSEWFSAEGIRLVRNVNIGHGEIRWGNTARIPFERQNDFPAFELQEGDILVSLDRPLISSGLKAARVRKQDLPSLLLQRVGRVVTKNGKVLPDYFYQWLNSPSFISSIDPGRSNGVPHISPKDVEKIPFTPPPLDEQRRIVAYLDGLQAKVNALRELQSQSQEELDALLPSILDKAFKARL